MKGTDEKEVESDVRDARVAPSGSMGPPAVVDGPPISTPVGKILRMLAGYPPSPTATDAGDPVEIVTEEEELGGGELLSISLPEDAAPTVSNDRRVVVVHDPLAELAEMAARDALAGGMPSAAATSPVVIVGIEYQDDLETRRSVGELEPASIQEVNHEGNLQVDLLDAGWFQLPD